MYDALWVGDGSFGEHAIQAYECRMLMPFITIAREKGRPVLYIERGLHYTPPNSHLAQAQFLSCKHQSRPDKGA